MHITDEMEDPAERHRLGACQGRTLHDVEVRLVGCQNVFCWWVNRLGRGWLALGRVGEVNIMPRGVMERRVVPHVVRPAGRQHEEIQLLLLSREVESRQSWHPLCLVVWVLFE